MIVISNELPRAVCRGIVHHYDFMIGVCLVKDCVQTFGDVPFAIVIYNYGADSLSFLTLGRRDRPNDEERLDFHFFYAKSDVLTLSICPFHTIYCDGDIIKIIRM